MPGIFRESQLLPSAAIRLACSDSLLPFCPWLAQVLLLQAISAHGVPKDGDAQGMSDPYTRFILLDQSAADRRLDD